MRKKIIIISIISVMAICLISLYSTFAFNEEENKLPDSSADYNLIYSLKEKSNKQVTINKGEEKYLDITLNNTYNSTVKYGIYYYLIDSKKIPENFTITLAEDSQDTLSNIINPNKTRNISLKIKNDSNYSVQLIIGALVGFENGNIEDLLQEGEILVK